MHFNLFRRWVKDGYDEEEGKQREKWREIEEKRKNGRGDGVEKGDGREMERLRHRCIILSHSGPSIA
jgi:hypothetical protein